MEIDSLEPWGVELFDQAYGGLPNRLFNFLHTTTKDASIVAVGHFLTTGIQLEQKVVLVSFEHPKQLFPRFKEYNFDFDEALLSEKLIYLYYKPVFSFSLNLAENYRLLFSEIKSLAKGKVQRIAFFNSEVLFNLETHLLAETSAEKIMAAFCDYDCVVLGCYQATNSHINSYLDEVCHTSLRSFIEITRVEQDSENNYELILHKSPLNVENNTIGLRLNKTSGFNVPNIGLIKHG